MVQYQRIQILFVYKGVYIMELLAIILLVVVVFFYYWQPWSRSELFKGDVNVEYKAWEAEGDAGRKVSFEFKHSGTYKINITSPTCVDCKNNVIKTTFKLLEDCGSKYIDLTQPYPKYVEVTVSRNGSEPETCTLYNIR